MLPPNPRGFELGGREMSFVWIGLITRQKILLLILLVSHCVIHKDSSFSADQAFLMLGHCSHSWVQVYVPGGACINSANQPAIPPLPDHIKNVNFVTLGYTEGVVLACGVFNRAPCLNVPVGVSSRGQRRDLQYFAFLK